jgi:hypothetical protein
MWFRRREARFVDLLKQHFGEGPDGPLLIAAKSEYVRSFPWARFTCRGLDYSIWQDRPVYGFGVQVGRADRPGRPADASAFDGLTLPGMQDYNEDMFYWEDIQVALGDPEISRDIHHQDFQQLLATVSSLEPRLQVLFSGEPYAALRGIREGRVAEVTKSGDAIRSGLQSKTTARPRSN